MARESPTDVSVRSSNWLLKSGGPKGKLLHSTRVKTDLTVKEHDIGPSRMDTTLKKIGYPNMTNNDHFWKLNRRDLQNS